MTHEQIRPRLKPSPGFADALQRIYNSEGEAPSPRKIRRYLQVQKNLADEAEEWAKTPKKSRRHKKKNRDKQTEATL